jgi:hypothetical protein
MVSVSAARADSGRLPAPAGSARDMRIMRRVAVIFLTDIVRSPFF